jgi:hypothetical protein
MGNLGIAYAMVHHPYWDIIQPTSTNYIYIVYGMNWKYDEDRATIMGI